MWVYTRNLPIYGKLSAICCLFLLILTEFSTTNEKHPSHPYLVYCRRLVGEWIVFQSVKPRSPASANCSRHSWPTLFKTVNHRHRFTRNRHGYMDYQQIQITTERGDADYIGSGHEHTGICIRTRPAALGKIQRSIRISFYTDSILQRIPSSAKQLLIPNHMIAALKNHPFAVEAFFDSSLVLTFAAPKEELQHFLPPCLELDTFQDKWGFVAMAMVQTRELRPKGFPRFMGNDFFLIGFRIFVKYVTNTGKRLRGLYIIRSQTDEKKMELMGNTFTHYNYTTTDIHHTQRDQYIHISSHASDFSIEVEDNPNACLPTGSPFANWKEARRYAGPLPFTFTYNEKTREVLIIEGVREHWEPQPVRVIDQQVAFMNDLALSECILANAFIIKNIPYYWKKGRIEKWKR